MLQDNLAVFIGHLVMLFLFEQFNGARRDLVREIMYFHHLSLLYPRTKTKETTRRTVAQMVPRSSSLSSAAPLGTHTKPQGL
jgi:hypothetical protein